MSPFFEIGQIVTFLYFFFFIILFPLIGFIEKMVYCLYIDKFNSESIATRVSESILFFLFKLKLKNLILNNYYVKIFNIII